MLVSLWDDFTRRPRVSIPDQKEYQVNLGYAIVPSSRQSVITRTLVNHQDSGRRHIEHLKVASEMCSGGYGWHDQAACAGGEGPWRGLHEVEVLSQAEQVLNAAVKRVTCYIPRPGKTTPFIEAGVLCILALLDARKHCARRLSYALRSKSEKQLQLTLHALAADAHILKLVEPAVHPRGQIALLRRKILATRVVS